LVVNCTNRKNAPFLFSTRTGTRPPVIGLDVVLNIATQAGDRGRERTMDVLEIAAELGTRPVRSPIADHHELEHGGL
jgi:hypothetical protein